MRELLQNQFSRQYDASGKSHIVNVVVERGDFSMHDDISCHQCQPFFSEQCEHETFKVSCRSEVERFRLEEFLNGFDSIRTDRCDAMLVGDNKLVLVDMYCGMSDYLDNHITDGRPVVGKKTKVRQQIESTLLCSVNEIRAYIEGIDIKEGVFVYRAKDEEIFQNIPRKVTASYEKFMKFNREISRRRLQLPMEYGFRYVMISYPVHYVW